MIHNLLQQNTYTSQKKTNINQSTYSVKQKKTYFVLKVL